MLNPILNSCIVRLRKEADYDSGPTEDVFCKICRVCRSLSISTIFVSLCSPK